MSLTEHLPWTDKRPRTTLEVVVFDQQALYIFDQSKIANEDEVFSAMLDIWSKHVDAEQILPNITSLTIGNLKAKGLIEEADQPSFTETLPYMQITKRGKDVMNQILKNREAFKHPIEVRAFSPELPSR